MHLVPHAAGEYNDTRSPAEVGMKFCPFCKRPIRRGGESK